MPNELPKQEDLIKERENLERKVAAIKAQKNREIEEKVAGIEKNRAHVKELQTLYNEAEENLQYYENLEKAGELPEDEKTNYEKAKALVSDIKTKMADHNLVVEKTMAIPEVEGKVREKAGQVNEGINKEKEEKEKEKLIRNKVSELVDKLVDEAQNLKENLDKLFNEWSNSRDDLFKVIEEKIDKNLANECERRSLHSPSSPMGAFRDILENYKRRLGRFSFRKKTLINKILNGESAELLNLATKTKEIKNLSKFLECFGNINCYIRGLLKTKGEYGEEIKKIKSLAIQSPYVNFTTILEGILENKGVKGINYQDFFDAISEKDISKKL